MKLENSGGFDAERGTSAKRPGLVGTANFVKRMLTRRYSWIFGGALATLLVGWLVVTQPAHAPNVGGVQWDSVLYYLQWVIYAAIIVLVGGRIAQYRRTRSPREDLGFVFGVTALYTAGFMLHYTPFVHEFPEGAFAGFVRAGVMLFCGLLGAVYGLSSTHRWY
jgi:hypothetical protein